MAELRVVYPTELAANATKESCWLVIDGMVYDVTGFHHPGGFNRLLELAGKDATKPFAAIRHSEAAHAHLRRMLVGRLAGASEVSEAPAPDTLHHSTELEALTGGSHHRAPKPGEALWSTRCRGFLPTRDPLVELPEPYGVLTKLVARMPVALSDGSFRTLVEAHKPQFACLRAAIDEEQVDDVLERVHSLYGYIGKGYVHDAPTTGGASVVPDFLADGWIAVSDRLGRLPTVDYADCVLNNWERIDKSAGLTPDNLRLLNRFTGLLDEEWFLKTHVIIESEASGVVSALYDGFRAVTDSNVYKLLAALSWLEQALSHVASNCLRIMFDRHEDDGSLCEPELFYHRFRPYISSWTALFEGCYENNAKLETLRSQLGMVESLQESVPDLPDLKAHHEHITAAIWELQKRRNLCGASGAMSAILPCVDAFLGVTMTSDELGAMLARFERYMPRMHRDMLESVRTKSARSFIMQLRHAGDSQAETLVDHFNGCVRRVLDFRWRHLSYIEQYVLRPSGSTVTTGTGGTPAFSYLNQHINDTEAAMIAWLDHTPIEGPLSPVLSDRAAEPPSVFRLSHPADDFWVVTDANGLLPCCTPLDWEGLSSDWEAVRELVRMLPAACVPPANFRRLVEASLNALPSNIESLASQEELERARSLLAFIDAGWRASGGVEPLPAQLDSLFIEVSSTLQRAPRLGLADLVLYNWSVDAGTREAYNGNGDEAENGPLDSTSSTSHVVQARLDIASMACVQPSQRFLCVEEEDWFCRLHVTLASGTSGVVAAINRCFDAQNVTEQVRALQLLEHAIEALVKIHYAAGIGQPIRRPATPRIRPSLLMQRLYRFLPNAPDLDLEPIELRAARVYCATGIDQACMMHVLGIAKGSHAMARFREWQLNDLPCAHRHYLEHICGRVSFREQVEREVGTRKLTVQQLAHLELAHNSCIDMLLRFFTRRWELVCSMFGETESLKRHWEQERQLISSARLKLLIERRAMAALETSSPMGSPMVPMQPQENGRTMLPRPPMMASPQLGPTPPPPIPSWHG